MWLINNSSMSAPLKLVTFLLCVTLSRSVFQGRLGKVALELCVCERQEARLTPIPVSFEGE